jgi:hypothetical protein
MLISIFIFLLKIIFDWKYKSENNCYLRRISIDETCLYLNMMKNNGRCEKCKQFYNINNNVDVD